MLVGLLVGWLVVLVGWLLVWWAGGLFGYLGRRVGGLSWLGWWFW